MNQILVFSFLIWSILNLTNANSLFENCVELDQICSDEVFPFNGVTVNSFCKMKGNYSFLEIQYFLINKKVDYEKLLINKSDLEEFNKMRRIYNKELIEIYSSNYVNQLNSDHSKIRRFDGLMKNLTKFYGKNELLDAHLDIVTQKIESGQNLLTILTKHKSEYLEPEIIDYKRFEFMLSFVKFEHYEHKLAIDNFEHLYQKGIFKFDHFKLNKFSKLFFDKRSSGNLLSNIYIPFEKQDYDPNLKCTEAKDLPIFYRSKGNDERSESIM